MRIVKFKANDIKRLDAVEINPEGDVIVITGPNKAGKSSVFDAIEVAVNSLAIDKDTVNKNADKGDVEIVTEDLIIKREIMASGSHSLTVTNKETGEVDDRETPLKKLYSKLCFDPLMFFKASPKEKIKILEKFISGNVTEKEYQSLGIKPVEDNHISHITNIYTEIFDERTETGREKRAAEENIEELKQEVLSKAKEFGMDISPEEDEDKLHLIERETVSDLVDEIQKNTKQIELINKKERDIEDTNEAIDKKIKEIEKLQLELAKLEDKKDMLTKDLNEFENSVDYYEEQNVKLNKNLSEIEKRNEVAEASKRLKKAILKADQKAEDYKNQTDRLDEIESFKKKKIDEALQSVVPGLKITNQGVEYNDVLIDNCSQAEQIVDVSLRIAIEQYPSLRVLLVRDGAFLDPDMLRRTREMIENEYNSKIENEKDKYMVWIETVYLEDAGDYNTIRIVDGSIDYQ